MTLPLESDEHRDAHADAGESDQRVRVGRRDAAGVRLAGPPVEDARDDEAVGQSEHVALPTTRCSTSLSEGPSLFSGSYGS